MAQGSEGRKAIPLTWEDIEGLPTVYANHVLVTHVAGSEFYVIFGEASPPTALLRHQEIDQVPIRPVAKIALSPEAMRRVVEVISKNFQSFQEASEGDAQHGE